MSPEYPIYDVFNNKNLERDLVAEFEQAQNELIQQLINKGFPVVDPIYVNRSTCEQQKGLFDEWSYFAWHWNDGETDRIECLANFANTPRETHNFSIPIQTIKRKKEEEK